MFDWAPIAKSILLVIQYAPEAITEAEALYAALKANFSTTDQASIDLALANAKASDAAATAAADTALEAAAKT